MDACSTPPTYSCIPLSRGVTTVNSLYILPKHEHTTKDPNGQDVACFFVHTCFPFLLLAWVELINPLMFVSSLFFPPILLLTLRVKSCWINGFSHFLEHRLSPMRLLEGRDW